MMFGLTFEKLLVIALIAVFLIGPQRLPEYAARFATLIKRLKAFTDTAQDRVKAELGDDADLLDWKSLDPRQYDPRRIIREALTDDPPGKGTTTVAPPVEAEPVAKPATRSAGTRD
jgi:sec-independent protein translocase protein TatB